jgi:hypothetical protein
MNSSNSASLLVMETTASPDHSAKAQVFTRDDHLVGEPSGTPAMGDRAGARDDTAVSVCTVLN